MSEPPNFRGNPDDLYVELVEALDSLDDANTELQRMTEFRDKWKRLAKWYWHRMNVYADLLSVALERSEHE